ncbi:MAG: hypothetical protein GX786_04315 [Clostridiales bacterium]|nr:hypothetical protein [Clostridiales bacterium]
MLKKIFSMLLLCFLLASSFLMVYGSSWQLIPVSEGFAGGSGTREDPFLISTKNELAYFSQQANSGELFFGNHIKLTENIRLNEGQDLTYAWVPIESFYGYFDGDGYTISGMYIPSDIRANMQEDINTYEEYHLGLFVNNTGIICNLTVSGFIDASSTPSDIYIYPRVAGIVSNHNFGILYNCTSSVNFYIDCPSSIYGLSAYQYNDSSVIECVDNSQLYLGGKDFSFSYNVPGGTDYYPHLEEPPWGEDYPIAYPAEVNRYEPTGQGKVLFISSELCAYPPVFLEGFEDYQSFFSHYFHPDYSSVSFVDMTGDGIEEMVVVDMRIFCLAPYKTYESVSGFNDLYNNQAGCYVFTMTENKVSVLFRYDGITLNPQSEYGSKESIYLHKNENNIGSLILYEKESTCDFAFAFTFLNGICEKDIQINGTTNYGYRTRKDRTSFEIESLDPAKGTFEQIGEVKEVHLGGDLMFDEVEMEFYYNMDWRFNQGEKIKISFDESKEGSASAFENTTNAGKDDTTHVNNPYTVPVSVTFDGKGTLHFISQSPRTTFGAGAWNKDEWPPGSSNGASSGCTVADHCMALSWLGVDVTPKEMVELKLVTDGSFNVISSGKMIASTMNLLNLVPSGKIGHQLVLPRISREYKNDYEKTRQKAYDNRDANWKELDKCIARFQDNPEVYAPPILRIFKPGKSSHTVIVIGKIDENTYSIFDSASYNHQYVRKAHTIEEIACDSGKEGAYTTFPNTIEQYSATN